MQSYYCEAVELIKNYEPAVKKLGVPLVFPKIDLSDKFNYHDEHKAQVGESSLVFFAFVFDSYILWVLT